MRDLILVEDHICFRQALAFLLGLEPGFGAVTQAGTLSGARGLLTEDVGLAVVDLHLPDGVAIDLIEDVRGVAPRSAVLVLTSRMNPGEWRRVWEAGADAVIHKTAGVAQIVWTAKRLWGSRCGFGASDGARLEPASSRTVKI